jgi:hypothetical protein
MYIYVSHACWDPLPGSGIDAGERRRPPSQPGEASTVPDPSRLAALMQVSVAAPPSQPGEASTVPDPSRLAIPTRRLRKKTTLIPVPQKKRRRTENLKGNPKGTGKKQMATIAEKEKIMST